MTKPKYRIGDNLVVKINGRINTELVRVEGAYISGKKWVYYNDFLEFTEKDVLINLLVNY